MFQADVRQPGNAKKNINYKAKSFKFPGRECNSIAFSQSFLQQKYPNSKNPKTLTNVLGINQIYPFGLRKKELKCVVIIGVLAIFI